MRRFLDCPACGATASDPVLRQTRAARERFLAFSRRSYCGVMDTWLDKITLLVRRCSACWHHWYEEQPEPEQLAAMYEALTPLHGGAPPRDPTPAMLERMRRLHSMVAIRRANGSSPATLLDYGSGHGRWARAAVAVGFAVVAFEPSRTRGAEEDAAARFEVVHDLGDLEGRRFDAVNLEQVLEHIPDPYAALSGILEHAKPSTVLRITTPNVLRCPEGGAFYDDWPYDGARAHTLAPFEHLNGFTPGSLLAVAARSGWRSLPLPDLLAADPANALRRTAGHLSKRFGQTLLYVCPQLEMRRRDASIVPDGRTT